MPIEQCERITLGYTITHVETTPNPLARKLIVDPLPGRIVSCFDVSKGSDDPLASAIIGCDGVTNVLIHTEFVSVCFSDQTRWATLKNQITRAIGSVDE
jgi:scaffold Nfu/NifU family protein